jgi:uncharacterized membrane protein YczE
MSDMANRLGRLLIGLFLYGFTMAMMVESTLGLDPWDVLHEGLAKHLPLTFGQVVIVVGAVVLLLWIPLRQMPGVGTICNVIVIGLAADAGIAVIAQPDDPWLRGLLLVGGVVGNGLAGAIYIGAQLGPGPRDGLWLGLVRRTGRSVSDVPAAACGCGGLSSRSACWSSGSPSAELWASEPCCTP